MKLIKSTKIILFILGMFFVGMAIINADTGTGSTTVTVTTQDCVGGWGGCSNGSQTYYITTPANGGTACPYSNGSTQSCGTAGYWSGWSGWGSCSVSSCGQTGSQTRSRSCIGPYNGGAPCSGSTSDSQSCSTAACPSGSISASSCTIGENGNSCNSSVSWSTSSPWGTSAVTTPSSITVANANSSGGTAYPVPNPDNNRTFYLYNNGSLLGQSTASASCAGGLVWTGGYCRVPVSGVCGSSNGGNFYSAPSSGLCNPGSASGISGSGPWSWTCNGSYTGTTASCSAQKAVDAVCSGSHYSCAIGNSVNNAESSPNWTWGCNGINGGTNTSCSQAIPTPSGLTTSCPNPGTTANVSWTLPSGYSLSYFRVNDNGSRKYSWIPEDVGDSGPSTSFSTTPGHSYYVWVHTRLPSGAYSNAIDNTFNCALPGACGGSHYSCVSGSSVSNSDNAANWTWNCNGSYGGANPSCSEIKYFNLAVNKAGTGLGDVTGAGTYTYNKSITATATPNAGSVFSGWSGDCNAGGQVTMTTNRSCTATFTSVTVGVTATPTTYSTTPSTNVSFTYTPTTNIGATECRLLDNASGALTGYQASSPIVYASPSSAGAYGYYVQCRNTSYTAFTAKSALITVTAVTVSVTATTPYNVLPGATVSFTYTPSTNQGVTECMLLDNVSTPLTAYKLASPISYAVPNNIGAYGYYVKCRNTVTTTALATSGLITVNTACANGLPGTTWNGSACVLPTGNLTASNCSIATGNSSCNTNLNWTTTSPFGTSAVTTPNSVTVASVNNGSATYPVVYGSRNFYLYNNGNILSQATATATNTSGVNTWDPDTQTCVAPTGILSASGCLIAAGNNTCPSNITWETYHPLDGVLSVVKTPNASGTTVGTSANTGSTTYPLLYNNNRSFVLVHGSYTLATASTPIATCALKTTWNGSICELNAPKIDTFTAEPSTIFEGRSSVITWSADPDLVTYCTGTGTGFEGSHPVSGGTVTVSPKTTTTYTLTCGRSGYPAAAKTAIIKVIVLTIKEQ
jgi:hypothetical protein